MSVLAVRINYFFFNLDIYGVSVIFVLSFTHQQPNRGYLYKNTGRCWAVKHPIYSTSTSKFHTSSKKMAGPIFSHLKLEGFDLTQTDYKQIGEHGIRADILVPRTLHTGKRPVLIRLHGGGLVRYLMEIQFYLQQL